jgi:hypothetical protein
VILKRSKPARGGVPFIRRILRMFHHERSPALRWRSIGDPESRTVSPKSATTDLTGRDDTNATL